MHTRAFPSLLMFPILLVTGCSSVTRTLENDGHQIATSFGENRENLKFVSFADISPAADLTNGFWVQNRGTIVISEDYLFWQNGIEKIDPNRPYFKIPLQHVNGFGQEHKLIHLWLENELHVLRLVSSAEGHLPSAKGARQLGATLTSLDIPEFEPEHSFRHTAVYRHPHTPRYRRSGSNDEVYDSPDDVLGQDLADQAHYDWVSSFGDDGVPLTPP